MGRDDRQDRPLPAGFLTTTQVADKRGFSIRTARNRAKNHKIGIKVAGVLMVSEAGIDALADNDTGALADVQRQVKKPLWAD